MILDKRRKGTFSEVIYNKMKNKGWFRVKDILPDYIKFTERFSEGSGYRLIYASGDCSFSLAMKCRSGLLERKPNKKHKDWFLYRVILK